MYITTYSMTEAYIQANEAELNRNKQMAGRHLIANTRKGGFSLNKLGDGLRTMSKMLKGKLAPSY